jgi:hypothetical protein
VKNETVVRERRDEPRLDNRAFQGTWAGAGPCRISDVSLSGCFVHSLSAPAQGEETSIALAIGNHTFTMRGRVVYVEPGLGFGLKFNEVIRRERDDLHRLLKALASEGDLI